MYKISEKPKTILYKILGKGFTEAETLKPVVGTQHMRTDTGFLWDDKCLCKLTTVWEPMLLRIKQHTTLKDSLR